jgi:transcriptional regulator with XRE-family HTH domain
MMMNYKGPDQYIYDYRMIKPIRLLRNKTLKEWGILMGTDPATISKIENGLLDFSPLYQERFKVAMQKARITNIEIVSVKTIIEVRGRKRI